ncbi:hypothetical protein L1987_01482 [Smallanthus sonchifolius]|uniref:Uncharacterized protein n=1 Tax=Smallanthus sonchifolius TaxID=185202 RepID=A0ACB9K584_9ASTR|nr:hypothetical protein L1987_01482 [Smallanthus sonchifolius]
MDSLNLQGDLDNKIQDVLRKSFDSLPRSSHKQLFLDIACFFVGESKYMVTILRGDLDAKSGIMTLINKCLLTVSPDTSKLMMHQLLQDMGRKIVCDESTHLIKRSRIWNDDESYCLLREGNVSDTIEGLELNIRNVGEGMRSEVRQRRSMNGIANSVTGGTLAALRARP